MLGDAAPYDVVHSFWSDQYSHKLAGVGLNRGGTRRVDKDGELAQISRSIAKGCSSSEAALHGGSLEDL